MKKIILILIFLGFLIKPVYAANLDVNCRGSGVCDPVNPGPIFLSSEVWYPGKTVSRSIKLLNTSGGSQKIITQPQNNVTSGDLSKVFTFSIVRNSDNQVIWSGGLESFFTKGEIELATLGDGVSDTFIYTAAMDAGAQNEYQGKQTMFDLKIGFAGVPESSSSSPSAPSCNDAKPGSAPNLISAVAGTNSVTLYWTEAADPVTYYLVSYGNYGNPNVGGKGTTSYTVTHLSGGTTYTFKVRAGNGCKPGDYSNELSVTPGGVFIEEGPAEGFIPGVLGVATPSAGLTTNNFPWWIFVGGGIAIVLAFPFMFKWKHESR
ncbi:MAG: fibronectin type III domain-containing protein [bacterium]|nr:fibronectin type III domain-containing protein [bacterium]